MSPGVKVLLATNNAHKQRELLELLAPLGIAVVTPAEVGGLPEVLEDRPTFAANASKKAVSAARERRMWALADDSGLLVDHLGGAPGVRSARWAGAHGDDAANNAKLLRELSGVPSERRGARFQATLALADPDGDVVLVVEGEARGRILEAPRGASGFGYDPLFCFAEPGLPQTGRTFAELSGADKSAVSHRGRALRSLARCLPAALGVPR